MRYNYEQAKNVTVLDLLMNAADILLRANGVNDQVKLSWIGGEVAKITGITTVVCDVEVLDPLIAEQVVLILESMAYDFAISQKVLMYINLDHEL